MGRQVSTDRLIKHLKERQVRLALSVTMGASDFEKYLIGAGAVRECRSLIQMLEKYTGKEDRPEPSSVRADDEPDDLDPDDPDEEEDDPDDEPAPARRALRGKPRQWGGG